MGESAAALQGSADARDIAPCGMVVYSGKLFTTWQNDILVAGLVAQSLVHLDMQHDRMASEERFYIGARVRKRDRRPRRCDRTS
jgi:glucose/arabinose dehydrogenase